MNDRMTMNESSGFAMGDGFASEHAPIESIGHERGDGYEWERPPLSPEAQRCYSQWRARTRQTRAAKGGKIQQSADKYSDRPVVSQHLDLLPEPKPPTTPSLKRGQ